MRCGCAHLPVYLVEALCEKRECVKDELGKALLYDNYVRGGSATHLLKGSREHVASGAFDKQFEIDFVHGTKSTVIYLIKK